MKGPHFFEKRKKEMARQEKLKQKAERKAQRKAEKGKGEGGEGDESEDEDEFSDSEGVSAQLQSEVDEGGTGRIVDEQAAGEARTSPDHVSKKVSSEAGSANGQAQGT
jgi:hypothetical protein